MFEKEFESMLRQYGDAIDDKKKFTGLIKDYFPEQAKTINLIQYSYNSDISLDYTRLPEIIKRFKKPPDYMIILMQRNIKYRKKLQNVASCF